VAAIRTGDFDRARDLLGELLATDLVERARKATAAGDPRGALLALDHALEVAPRSPSILCARGEAVLAIPDQERDAKLLESARANFLAAAALDPGPNLPRAWLGASRAARGLGRLSDACEHARRGIAAATDTRFDDPLRRALAEAVFDDYAAARGAGAPADAIATRARTTRDALEDLLGRTPEEPWPWARLAELAESERAPAEARDVAARGLRIAPDDPALSSASSLAARALGGPSAAVEAFERVCRDHPDVAAGRARARARALRRADGGREAGPRSALEARRGRNRGAAGSEARGSGPPRTRHWLAPRAISSRSAAARSACGRPRSSTSPGAHGVPLDGGRSQRRPRPRDPLDRRKPRDRRPLRRRRGLRRAGRDRRPRAGGEDLRPAPRGRPGGRALRGRRRTYHQEAAIQLELQARAAREKPADAERLLVRARKRWKPLASPWPTRCDSRPRTSASSLARARSSAATSSATPLRRSDTSRRRSRSGNGSSPPAAARGRARARGGRAAVEAQDPRRRGNLVGDAAENLGRVHLKLVGDAAKAREWLERSRRTGADPRPGIDELIGQCDDAIARKTDPRVKDENRWAASAPHGRTP
jgi:hypothetical protein